MIYESYRLKRPLSPLEKFTNMYEGLMKSLAQSGYGVDIIANSNTSQSYYCFITSESLHCDVSRFFKRQFKSCFDIPPTFLKDALSSQREAILKNHERAKDLHLNRDAFDLSEYK